MYIVTENCFAIISLNLLRIMLKKKTRICNLFACVFSPFIISLNVRFIENLKKLMIHRAEFRVCFKSMRINALSLYTIKRHWIMSEVCCALQEQRSEQDGEHRIRRS